MLEASGAPAFSDPTPVCQFPGAREEGLGGPGGLGHRQQWHLPPTLSPFPHWVAFPAGHQSLKMALLNSITAPWEGGLALPSVHCGAVAATQGQCPSVLMGSPLRGQPLPSAQRYAQSQEDTWKLRGRGVHAASAEVLHLCARLSLCATYIHL